jgi:hypothetical protein
MQTSVQASNRLQGVAGISPIVAGKALQDGPTIGLHPDVAVQAPQQAAAAAKVAKQQQALAGNPAVSHWVWGAPDAHVAAAQDSLPSLGSIANGIMHFKSMPWDDINRWSTQQTKSLQDFMSAPLRDVMTGLKQEGQEYVSRKPQDALENAFRDFVGQPGTKPIDPLQAVLGAITPPPFGATRGGSLLNALATAINPFAPEVTAGQHALQDWLGTEKYNKVVQDLTTALAGLSPADVEQPGAFGQVRVRKPPPGPEQVGEPEVLPTQRLLTGPPREYPAEIEPSPFTSVPPEFHAEFEPGPFTTDPEQFPPEGVSPEHDGVRRAVANVDAELIRTLQERIADSPLLKTSPEVMEGFLDSLTDHTVYVDPEKLLELARDGHEPFPDHARDIAQAAADGSQFEVPLSKYLTATAGQPFAEELNSYTTFRDGGTSLEEAEADKPVEPPRSPDDVLHDIQTVNNAVERGYIDGNDPRVVEAQEYFRQEHNRLMGVEGPDDLLPQAEGLAPAKEEIEGQPGVNARRLANMLGPQLYGDPSDIAAVSVKEILQNSFDALKQSLDQGDISQGRIHITRHKDSRTITFHDNGVGMAPELLGGKFLQIAGSEKAGTQSSGGFGIAKMLFLYGNNELIVQTMKDGVYSEMRTSGPELMEGLEEGGKKPKIQVLRGGEIPDEARQLFPDGHGTKISIQIPETYQDTKTGKEEKIQFPYDVMDLAAVKRSPLFHNVAVTSENYGMTDTVPIGMNFPAHDFTTFVNVKFPWGTAKVYISRTPVTNRWGEPLHILSNGLWQFSEALPANPQDPWGPRLPFDIYVDLKPTVKPDQAGYPFNFNRQELTKEAKSDFAKIKAYIQATYARKALAESGQDFSSIHYLTWSKGEVVKSAPVDVSPKAPKATQLDRLQEGDQVEIKDGVMYVNGKAVPELTPEDLKLAVPSAESLKIPQTMIEPNSVILHDNTKLPDGRSLSEYMDDTYGEDWHRFLHHVGSSFIELRNAVAEALEYDDLLVEGVGISFDPTYRGVSIKIPFSGMFINPLGFESALPLEGSYGIFGTMVHELAHFKVRSHNAAFPAEMQKIQYTLQAGERLPGAFNYASWLQNFIDGLTPYHQMMLEGKEKFEHGNLTAARKSFSDASTEPTAYGGDEGHLGDLAPARQGTERGPELPEGVGAGEQPGEGGGGHVEVSSESKGKLDELSDTLTHHADLVRKHVAATQRALRASYLRPLFQNAKALGMTEAQFAAYSQQIAKIHSDAINAAHQRAMTQIMRERKPDWRAKVKENSELAERQMAALPAVQAWSILESGKGPLGEPIERPFKMLASDPLALHGKDLGLPDKMFGRKGLPVDQVAGILGFGSGADMIRDLAQLGETKGKASLREYMKEQVRKVAELQTRAELGHDLTPDSIQEAANEQVNGPARTDLLSEELKMLGATPLDIDKLKAYAAEKFQNFSVRRALNFQQLEKTSYKLGEKVERELLQGNTDVAFIRKQQQFVQHLVTQEAYGFRKEYQKADRAINRLAKRPILPSMDQEARNFARYVVQRMGYKVRTGKYVGVEEALRGKSLDTYVKELTGLGTPVWDATVPYNQNRDPRTLSVNQFLDNWQMIDSLSKLGRWMKKVFAEGKAAELADIVRQIKENADKVGRRLPAGERRRLEKKLKGKLGRGARAVGSAVARPETYMFWLDGEKVGPLTRYIVNELQNGKYYFGDRTAALAKAFKDFTESQSKGWDKSLSSDVFIPELTYSIDKDGTPVRWIRTRDEAIMLATHTGSESNFKKLTEGFGWDGDTVRTVLNRVLTKADWNYVQFILDQHKILLPDVQELYRATVGLPTKGIEATPIRTPFGTYAGGYRHIDYDWNSIGEFENEDGQPVEVSDPNALGPSELFGGDFRVATPPNRYTESRVEFSAPINLSHDILHKEFEMVIHDLAYRKGLIQASKIMKQPAVRQAFREVLGPEYLSATNRWLQDIAQAAAYDQASLKFFAGVAKGFRRVFTQVQLGYNLATLGKHSLIAASHITGEVGADKFMMASGELMQPNATGEALRKFVYDTSGEVRNALLNLDRDVRELIMDEFRKKGAVDSVRYNAFAMFAWMKQAESYGLWLAKYREMVKTESEEDAVALANKAVRDTQGAGAVVDLPALWRGGSDFWGQIGKLSNMFTNFENTQTNREWTMIQQVRRGGKGFKDRGWAGGKRDFGKIFTGSMAYLIGPALLATAFTALTSGDHKHLIRQFFGNLLKGTLGGSMPGGNILADIPDVMATREHTFHDDPLGEALTDMAFAATDLWSELTQHRTTDPRWVEHAANTAGYLFNLPVKPISKSGQYIWDLTHGRETASDPLDLIRGLLFGPKPKEARY